MEDHKLFFLPFGFWVFVLGLATAYVFYRIVRIYFWPKTKGKIVKSYLEERLKKLNYNHYIAHIEYTYVVNGKTYISTKIFISDIPTDKGTAEKLIKEFPEGKEVDVYYNPLRPKEAILKRSFTTNMFIQLLVFFGMFSVFLFTLFYEIIYYGEDVAPLAQKVKQFLHKIFYGE